jgi:hypothetical protein
VVDRSELAQDVRAIARQRAHVMSALELIVLDLAATALDQPDEGAPRRALDSTSTTSMQDRGILRELGIAVRAARFTPDHGPAVRLDVQDASLWLTPREVAALQLALTNAVRKATS